MVSNILSIYLPHILLSAIYLSIYLSIYLAHLAARVELLVSGSWDRHHVPLSGDVEVTQVYQSTWYSRHFEYLRAAILKKSYLIKL